MKSGKNETWKEEGKSRAYAKRVPGEYLWGKEWNVRKRLRLKGSPCTLV